MLPEDPYRIPRGNPVVGDERKALRDRLSNEGAVKGIVMMEWEGGHSRGMAKRELQFAPPEGLDLRLDIANRDPRHFAECALDRDLPSRDRAEPDFPRIVLHQRNDGGREPVGICHPPQKDVRIDEVSHWPGPSNAALMRSSSASKSGRTTTWPLHFPGLSSTTGRRMGESRAIAFPALARTNSSPLSTSLRILDK